jgi:hypothetical protein
MKTKKNSLVKLKLLVTAPPSYTKKDVLQYIRGMSIEDRETLYEEMSAQADF